jgi:predicted RNase H-like nuclease (RuvC/YqgF family)
MADTRTRITELGEEIAELTRQLELCDKCVRGLMAEEDPASGRFFAQEIHQQQQDKNRIRVEIEIRKKRVRRLEQGLDEEPPAPGRPGLAL